MLIIVIINILYVKNVCMYECCLNTKYQTNGSSPENINGIIVYKFCLIFILQFLFFINFIIEYIIINARFIDVTTGDKNFKFLLITNK